MNIRIALAVPPVQDFYITPHRNTALGALTVAGLLNTSGTEARVFNFIGAKGTRGRSFSQALPAPLSYLTPYLHTRENGRDGFFKGYHHFGPTYGECVCRIAAWKPDVIAVSLFAFAYAREALEFSQLCRKELPRIPLIIGGPGVSVCPRYFSRTGLFSLVCPGEAEPLTPLLIDALGQGLPPPSEETILSALHTQQGKDIFPVWHTSAGRRTLLTTALSRGCPMSCSFCSTRITHGKGFRCGSVSEWLSALPALPPGAPVDINLEDDNLLCAPDTLFAFLTELRTRFPDGRLMMENGIDFRLLSHDRVKRLHDAGMRHFNISLGTGEDGHRRYEDWAAALETIRNNGGWATTYCIPGEWGDTPFRAGNILGKLARHRTQIGLSMFYPVPGIEGFEDRDRFMDMSTDRMKGSSAYPWTGTLSTKDLVTAFMLSRWINRIHFFGGADLSLKDKPDVAGQFPASSQVMEGYFEGIRSS